MSKKISVKKNILSANDQLALKIRKKLDNSNTFSINIMASPGGGKTSIILKTIKALKKDYQIGVVDGDLVDIDIQKIKKLQVPVALANTGGACHLDAVMVEKALQKIDLTQIDLLIIENVGNLICPSHFKIGTHKNVVIASYPEGDDKPQKYPAMFKGADLILLNKSDLKPYLDFKLKNFQKGLAQISPSAQIIELSAKTNYHIPTWINWIKTQTHHYSA